MEEHPEYSCSVKFTWKINNFSTIDAKKIHSNVFTGGDHKWMIAVYPKGCEKDGFLSIFLEVPDSATFPSGGNIDVKFSLSVISEFVGHTVKKVSSAVRTFNADQRSWGYDAFIPLDQLRDANKRYLVRDTCLVRAKVWYNEENVKEKSNCIEEKSSFSFSQLDTLFTDIENSVEGAKTTYSTFSENKICDAETIFRGCLDMDPTSFIRSGKAPELKNALSLLLTAQAFPDSAIEETTKFLANLDERCKEYEAAKRDLSEAQEDGDSVEDLKTNLKDLSSKFAPVRKQAEAIDSEIARLEEVLAERKAKRERLGKRLNELAEQATTSKQALIRAEEQMKQSMIKKGEANKMLQEFKISWESLKDLHFVINRVTNDNTNQH